MLERNDLTQKSKFLALILRHKPEKANLTLDKNGWALVSDLTDPKKGNFKLHDLVEIVKADEKKRYEFDAGNEKIRACQGHSIREVDVQLEKVVPPGELYHGTKEDFKMEIAKKGLLPMNRQHVHMTTDLKTAQETADRRKGKSVILVIDSCQMSAKGYKFYKASNGVYLTTEVPAEFIREYKK